MKLKTVFVVQSHTPTRTERGRGRDERGKKITQTQTKEILWNERKVVMCV